MDSPVLLLLLLPDGVAIAAAQSSSCIKVHFVERGSILRHHRWPPSLLMNIAISFRAAVGNLECNKLKFIYNRVR